MSLVACKASFVTVDGRFEEDLYKGFAPITGKEAWRTLLAYNFIATPSVLVRRTAIDAVGAFAPELIVGEDQDLWIRLALFGEIGFIPQPLVIVHAQPDSLSHQASLKLLDYGLPMIMRHFREQQHRLSPQEQRFILGHRFTKFGRLTYRHSPWRGFKLIAKAIWLGHDRVPNLRHLVMGSPLAKFVKRFV